MNFLWLDFWGYLRHLSVWFPKPVSSMILAIVATLISMVVLGVAMMISNHLFPDD